MTEAYPASLAAPGEGAVRDFSPKPAADLVWTRVAGGWWCVDRGVLSRVSFI